MIKYINNYGDPEDSAVDFYKNVEHFENVKYLGHGQWEGIDCKLNSFPSIDIHGNSVDRENKGRWFILGKYWDEEELVGFKLMDLNGNVSRMGVQDTYYLGQTEGFVNAKFVNSSNPNRPNDVTISALKGSFRDFQVNVNRPTQKSEQYVSDSDGQMTFGFGVGIKEKERKMVMDEKIKKERYIKLADMFGKKEVGKCTNADIAKVVGATSNADFSQKIHDYLGEDYSISDREILQKLYKVYKSLQLQGNTPTLNVSNQKIDRVQEPLRKDNSSENAEIQRMRELIKTLTKAAEVYYSGEDEIMSNYEYDKLYDELSDLEKKTGTILPGSLTQKVGFEVMSKLQKVKHEYKALSLDKTKDRQELANSLGGQPGFLSWKLDGCFNERVKITMSDGTFKYIKDVNPGDMVLTVNEKGQLCREPVINKFYNGKKEMSLWCKIYFGSKYAKNSTMVTQNHLFMTPNGWKKASLLHSGDLVLKNLYKCSKNQLSFLVGASFGDGSILNRNRESNLDFYNGLEFRYSKKVSDEYRGLMNRFEMLFSDILGNTRLSKSGYGTEMYTRFLKTLYSLPIDFIRKENFFNTSIHFNKNTLKYLGALGLAIYYIDDGSKTPSKNDGYNVKNVRSRCTFSMYRYDKSDILAFSSYLKKEYGINSKIRLERILKNGKEGYVLDIDADGTEILFDIIAPYIPKELRKVKLSHLPRWQDVPEEPWWECKGNDSIVEVPVSYVEMLEDKVYNGRKYRIDSYDLEVRNTHNYFANGTLVHNCTTVLTYEKGELKQAVTRGDGITGEDITHNAKFFEGVPLKIGYKDKLVIRGEALISYKDFEKINATITNVDDKYKNPRNLASGSIRQLDSKIAKERHVRVIAFTVVEGFDDLENYSEKLNELKKYGFEVVDFVKVTKDTTVAAIGEFEKRVKSLPYPTDGLVITIDNIAYGEMLGTTAKFPRNAKAFKWADEDFESTLIDIEWSVGRTGAITPVAIFKPVDIDGAIIQRASMHNISVMYSLLGSKPFKGQKIWIIRSNMVIPQIVRAEKND